MKTCLVCLVKPAGNCWRCKSPFCEEHRRMNGEFTSCLGKQCVRIGTSKFKKSMKSLITGGLHKTHHAFQKLMKRRVVTGTTLFPTFKSNGLPGKPKKVYLHREEWKAKGYKAIQAAEKFVSKTPGTYEVRCDDDIFAGSSLIVIPHETRKKYMGASVTYIPQCTGENPTTLFLYPHHVNHLMKVLKKLQKKAKKKM